MGRSLGRDTVTLITPAVQTDPVDNTTWYDYGVAATRTDIKNCSVQPFLLAEKLQFEITAERTFARSTLRVFAPSTALTRNIQPNDRVIFDGLTYEVFGHVGRWSNIGSQPDHVAFIIMLREG